MRAEGTHFKLEDVDNCDKLAELLQELVFIISKHYSSNCILNKRF